MSLEEKMELEELKIFKNNIKSSLKESLYEIGKIDSVLDCGHSIMPNSNLHKALKQIISDFDWIKNDR